MSMRVPPRPVYIQHKTAFNGLLLASTTRRAVPRERLTAVQADGWTPYEGAVAVEFQGKSLETMVFLLPKVGIYTISVVKYQLYIYTGWWFKFLFFTIYGDVIPPIDELIFFKMVSLPPTSYRCDVQLSTIGGSWMCLIYRGSEKVDCFRLPYQQIQAFGGVKASGLTTSYDKIWGLPSGKQT